MRKPSLDAGSTQIYLAVCSGTGDGFSLYRKLVLCKVKTLRKDVRKPILCFTCATNQSLCLHETLTTAAITSKIRKAYFSSFITAGGKEIKRLSQVIFIRR